MLSDQKSWGSFFVLAPWDKSWIFNNFRTVSYNVTVEELEVRVERLEEDMFLVQDNVNELQYTVQETIETVSYISSN